MKLKIKLEIEFEYDDDSMHSDDADSIAWFHDQVLLNPTPDEQLILHSNCIGDEIGVVKVTRIISSQPAPPNQPTNPR